MISFLLSLAALIAGYFIYGAFVEKVFGIEPERKTPAVALNDGVDYVPLPWKKILLIQILNIAGLGPIFGAIMGALYGPAAFLWIVLGTIFAGAVHDFFSGMLSVRHDGKSISEIVGIYLGDFMKNFMRVFSVILLVLVGTVFIAGPAGLLANLGMTGILANKWFWLAVIIAYYFFATILPIDKIIARFYPVFGIVLLVMALGIGIALLFYQNPIPEITLSNLHPKQLPIWPMLFITIACGAISGFHSTQSPLMARCIETEKYGRRVFYGAMVAEGIIALVWAAAAMTFFNGIPGLAASLGKGGAGVVVHDVSIGLLGVFGGVLAILGVIACPITSGDTAFRSARLTIADALNFDQQKTRNRLLVAAPLFAIGLVLNFMDFSIIWRYFAWSNQTLATIVLWGSAAYLAVNNKLHWIATIPATFMTAVCVTYIMIAPEGLKLSTTIAYPVGIIAAVAAFAAFMAYNMNKTKEDLAEAAGK
ncbi:MAG TPA: carbon starvation protein A [Spirochaetota bacterium]|nr:carbon starvation protein A [Spirochaetota bacterium]HPJ43639.1 carbon starvation protein A [Spirochaetota bacterium]HPR38612.1 carbon starvation protein A [Spirochaetota bacterium]